MDTNHSNKGKVSFGYASRHLKLIICITLFLLWVIASVFIFQPEKHTENNTNKADEIICNQSYKTNQVAKTQNVKNQDSKVDDSKENEEKHGALTMQEKKSLESIQVIEWNEEASKVEKQLTQLEKQVEEIDCNITEKDVEALERIVEAEAPDEDMIGKILIANVVLNRVESDEFPNTAYSVIHQRINGRAQFSPLDDGRYNTVTVSQSSKEAVQSALAGEDYSQGALFFAARSLASNRAMSWFDTNLNLLFEHGVHEFFTYKM